MNTCQTSRRVRVQRSVRRCAGWHAALLIAGCGVNSPDVSTPPPDSPIEHVGTAVVEEVVDGDTIRLRIDGSTETVRLIAIDTPETKHPTKRVECFGPEASSFLETLLVTDTTVRVERDVEPRDAYGRLLLYVFLRTNAGEMLVNREVVLRGFARPLMIEPNTRYQQQIVAAAFDAQRHARGLWKHCK